MSRFTNDQISFVCKASSNWKAVIEWLSMVSGEASSRQPCKAACSSAWEQARGARSKWRQRLAGMGSSKPYAGARWNRKECMVLADPVYIQNTEHQRQRNLCHVVLHSCDKRRYLVDLSHEWTTNTKFGG